MKDTDESNQYDELIPEINDRHAGEPRLSDERLAALIEEYGPELVHWWRQTQLESTIVDMMDHASEPFFENDPTVLSKELVIRACVAAVMRQLWQWTGVACEDIPDVFERLLKDASFVEVSGPVASLWFARTVDDEQIRAIRKKLSRKPSRSRRKLSKKNSVR